MKEMMRAMVLSNHDQIENRPLELKTIEKPILREKNGLIIKIEACGVCRSNLHLVEGDWKKYGIPPTLPLVPGHEVVGTVIKIGDTVKKIKLGDRVGIQPLYSSCLQCEYCINNHEHLCNYIQVTGETVNGGYAEYLSITEDFVTPIPGDLDPENAAPLFCPGITAYKAVKASDTSLGKSVAIYGIGGVGHLAIQLAKFQGARVVAISRSKNHLDLAKRLNADNVMIYDTKHDDFLARLKKEEGLLDSAIVFAPSNEVVDSAIKSVKKGGTIVIGVFASIPNFLFGEEKIIKGSVIGSRKDMIDLLKIAKEKDLRVVTKSYALEKANEVLYDLKISKIEARAVLVP